MNERYNNPEKYSKSQELRDNIDMLGLEYLAYTKRNVMHPDSAILALKGPEGQRVLIEKVDPTDTIHAGERKGRFLQDTCVQILPGEMQDPGFEKIEYNFGQYYKDELRYRETIGDARAIDVEFGDIGAIYDSDLAKNSFKHWYNDPNILENAKFEERMGYNNQIATDEQIDDILDILNHSTVLDPNNNYLEIE